MLANQTEQQRQAAMDQYWVKDTDYVYHARGDTETSLSVEEHDCDQPECHDSAMVCLGVGEASAKMLQLGNLHGLAHGSHRDMHNLIQALTGGRVVVLNEQEADLAAAALNWALRRMNDDAERGLKFGSESIINEAHLEEVKGRLFSFLYGVEAAGQRSLP